MRTGNLIQLSSLAADIDTERVMAAQAGLVVHEAESLNCETPPALLDGALTLTAQFYRRSHFPIPVLDPSAWRLGVRGMVRQPLGLSLLRPRMPGVAGPPLRQRGNVRPR